MLASAGDVGGYGVILALKLTDVKIVWMWTSTPTQ
jgi:hypothetical protein